MSNILIIILKRWLYFLIWSSFNHYNISRCPIPYWNGISSQEPIWLDNKTLSFSPGLCYLTRPWGCTILAPSSDQGGIYFLRLTFAHLFWQPKLFSLSLTTLNVRFSDKDLLIIQVLSTGTHASSLSVL